MKLTLEFDSPEAADNFIGWWLDGGGEQIAQFNTETWDLDTKYMRITGDGNEELDEEDEG